MTRLTSNPYWRVIPFCAILAITGCKMNTLVIDVPSLQIYREYDAQGGDEPYVVGFQWSVVFGEINSARTSMMLPEKNGPGGLHVHPDAPHRPVELGSSVRRNEVVHLPEWNGKAIFYNVPKPASIKADVNETGVGLYGLTLCGIEADNRRERSEYKTAIENLQLEMKIGLNSTIAPLNFSVKNVSEGFDGLLRYLSQEGLSETGFQKETIGNASTEIQVAYASVNQRSENMAAQVEKSALGVTLAGIVVKEAFAAIPDLITLFKKKPANDRFVGCSTMVHVNLTEEVWEDFNNADGGPQAACSVSDDGADDAAVANPVCAADKNFPRTRIAGSPGREDVGHIWNAQPYRSKTNLFTSSMNRLYSIIGDDPVVRVYADLPDEDNVLTFATVPEFRIHEHQEFSLRIFPTSNRTAEYELTTTGHFNSSATVKISSLNVPDYVKIFRRSFSCSQPFCSISFPVPNDGIGMKSVLIVENYFMRPYKGNDGNPFFIEGIQTPKNGEYNVTVAPGYKGKRGASSLRFTLLTWPEYEDVKVADQILVADADAKFRVNSVKVPEHDILLVTPVGIAGDGRTSYTTHYIGGDGVAGELEAIAMGGKGDGKRQLRVLALKF